MCKKKEVMGVPKKMEATLKKEVKNRGFKDERADKYVYGTMRKSGWKPQKRGK